MAGSTSPANIAPGSTPWRPRAWRRWGLSKRALRRLPGLHRRPVQALAGADRLADGVEGVDLGGDGLLEQPPVAFAARHFADQVVVRIGDAADYSETLLGAVHRPMRQARAGGARAELDRREQLVADIGLHQAVRHQRHSVRSRQAHALGVEV